MQWLIDNIPARAPESVPRTSSPRQYRPSFPSTSAASPVISPKA